MAKLNPKTKKAVAAAVRAAKKSPKRNPIIEGRGFLTASTIKKKAKETYARAKKLDKKAQAEIKKSRDAKTKAAREEAAMEARTGLVMAYGLATEAAALAWLAGDSDTGSRAEKYALDITDDIFERMK